MGEMRTDQAELSGIANRLHSAAEGMNGPASSQADPPNAGESTDATCKAIESVSRAVAALTETASKTAGDVDAAKDTYGTVEDNNSDLFSNIEQPGNR